MKTLKGKGDAEVNAEQEIKELRRKNQRKGCTWTLLLFFGPVFLFFGYIQYHLEWKESSLVLSKSPSGKHVIEIVEKGETILFGPSSVRIKYENQHADRSISNDGGRLNDANASVEWTGEGTALITLDGGEQNPEFIRFDSQSSDLFETIQVELEAITVAISQSPDQANQIEIKEITRSAGEEFVQGTRIYYGESGRELEEYRDLEYVFGADRYAIEWVDSQHASIEISIGNKIIETQEIDFTQ